MDFMVGLKEMKERSQAYFVTIVRSQATPLINVTSFMDFLQTAGSKDLEELLPWFSLITKTLIIKTT